MTPPQGHPSGSSGKMVAPGKLKSLGKAASKAGWTVGKPFEAVPTSQPSSKLSTSKLYPPLRASVGMAPSKDPLAGQKMMAKWKELIETQLEPIKAAGRIGNMLLQLAGLKEGLDVTWSAPFEAAMLGVMGGAPGGGQGPANIPRRWGLKLFRKTYPKVSPGAPKTLSESGKKALMAAGVLPDTAYEGIGALSFAPEGTLGRAYGHWARRPFKTGIINTFADMEEKLMKEVGFFPARALPRIRIHPELRHPESTVFHEFGHHRHLGRPELDPVRRAEARLRSLTPEEMKGKKYTEIYRMEQDMLVKEMTDTELKEAIKYKTLEDITRLGEKTSIATGRKFYWEDPKEIIARKIAAKAEKEAGIFETTKFKIQIMQHNSPDPQFTLPKRYTHKELDEIIPELNKKYNTDFTHVMVSPDITTKSLQAKMISPKKWERIYQESLDETFQEIKRKYPKLTKHAMTSAQDYVDELAKRQRPFGSRKKHLALVETDPVDALREWLAKQGMTAESR